MKILMTGAHLTPALAMIDYLRAKHPEDEIVFVGRLFSQEKLAQKAVEASEIKKRGIKFIPFRAVKFVGHATWDLFLAMISFPQTVARAKKILRQEKVDVFLSFGSYLAVPFALAAKFLQIPIVTHEQTIAMGKANQFIANLADRVAISFAQTADYLKKDNYVLTGNPIRPAIFAKNLTRPSYLPSTPKNLLLVMGGNQGSLFINELIKSILPELLKNFTVVHQCGRANKLKNYPQELLDLRASLPLKDQARYFIREWMSEKELFWLYQQANMAVSRAGANSVLEMCLVPLPAVLIPLPHTYNNEQGLNAAMMKQAGGALVLEQAGLSAKKLLNSIELVNQDRLKMRANLAKQHFYRQAELGIYQLLKDVTASKN